MDSAFENYAIIQHLRCHEPPFYAVIEQLYTISQNLLAEIPKTFSNYTIHDIGHSIRVVGYMDFLVKNRVAQFSALHLMLIVCAGLLHDIGMVVSDDEAEKLYQEFEVRNPDFRKFSDEKKRTYLQDYVRKKHGERVAAMIKHPINDATKIKSLFFVGDTKSYDLSELAAEICRSHTESCDWIEANLDRELHYGNYEINPQQIALLLRIGDALDIDDRRAPYMLYQLLNPMGISNVEWRKHIPITNYDKICLKENMYVIMFSGECNEPKIYRKILDYINWIQTDLRNMATLCVKFKSIYQLNICDTIEVSIKTRGFVATHLTFSLEYQQISKLLMGEKIYGSKQDGLRELLQNAIDAVLLMRDIEKRNPYSVYFPIVGIEIDEDARQVVIFDNGVGMSQRILQNYFFNIGNSYYISDEFMAGEYVYQPIGHFGIGFLACFMLSSKIRLETKHYQDHEMILMDFERDSSYVTRLNSNPKHPLEHGTRIVLDYDQIIPEIFPDVHGIYTYLKGLLVAGDYQMMLIHNRKKEVMLPKLKKYDYSDGEKTEFSYSISKYLNVRFDLFNFFENNEKIYIVDDTPEDEFFCIGYFEDVIFELEYEYQAGESTWEEVLMKLPAPLYLWLCRNVPDFKNVFNGDIRILFELYLNSFIQDSVLIWYELPVIYDKSTFTSFWDMIDEDGVETALTCYKNVIDWISILSREPLSIQTVFKIVEKHLELNDKDYDVTDAGYYLKYPVQPIQKAIQLLNLPDTDYYLRIIPDVQVLKSRVYLKGIRIKNESITLPYSIEGIDIEYVFLNVCSGNYDTNVARSSFDAPSKKKLGVKAAKLIYEDIMRNADLDLFEKSLIKRFLDTYYN